MANAQSQPLLQAQKCFGGTRDDEANSMQLTKDGGCIIAGYSNSIDGNVSGNHGDYDYWIVKLDASGKIKWQKSYGGTRNDQPYSIQQTKDGGYIVAGFSDSNDGDVTGHHGDIYSFDYWVVKLDTAGNIQWQKSLGGTNSEFGKSIQQTNDGGYIVAGSSNSIDGDIIGHHGTVTYNDCWIVKLSATGNIQWQKSLGGTLDDAADCIRQTIDGGYIVAGYAKSNDGDVSGHHGTTLATDSWIVKLDATGNIQWQRSLGGSEYEGAGSIQQTKDSGYIIASHTRSNDGDVSGNHSSSIYYSDYWIVKLDVAGNIKWQKCLGGSYEDVPGNIQQTKEGGYIVTGSARSNDGNVSGNHSSFIYSDAWVVKLNNAGTIEWQECLGGTSWDGGSYIQQAPDGSYINAGFTSSKDGDVNGNHGSADYWIVKLSASGNLISQQPILFSNTDNSQSTNYPINRLTIFPNPVQSTLHIRGLSSNINYQLKIINENGTVLLQSSIKNISSYDMNVSKLASGVYYLQAGEEKIKFVKE